MPSVIYCLTVDVASFCAAVGVAADADDTIRVNVIAAAENNSDVFCIIVIPIWSVFETLYLSCYVHFYTKGAWLTNNKKHPSIKLPRKGSSAIKNIVFVCNDMTQNINI
ncbi:hypothetical protein CFC25_02555 [Salmonella enterica subsp. enterica serovar Hvittingfoss]|nr:hypothetical protein [Salmonella enterica subsp. enterica serovar Hvittingfoss]EDX4555746.1 hypothetical protein [Salmonella enterica subsp. enterica serovar Hvittingfoss]